MRDRRRQQARLADPLEPGQLAVAVEAVAAGEDRLGQASPSCGHDDRDAGPDRALADDERPVALDERRVARRARPATSVMALCGPGVPRPMRDARGRALASGRCVARRRGARRAARTGRIIRRVIPAAPDPTRRHPAHVAPLRLRRLPDRIAAARADRRRRGVPRPARAWPCSRAPGRAATPAGPT